MNNLLITPCPNSLIGAGGQSAATSQYLAGMTESPDPLAENIGHLQSLPLASEKYHETACRAIAPRLLAEARHIDEDLVITALSRFCARDLGPLLAQHRHAPAVCAKVLRANFHRLLLWRQRDAWRRANRRRIAEEEFSATQVRNAYEVSRELDANAVLAEVAALDNEMARLLSAAGEVSSLDELHGRLAGVLQCSKATVRRRLLALGQRMRWLLHREAGRFLAERPASHLPFGTGACAARVIHWVFATA